MIAAAETGPQRRCQAPHCDRDACRVFVVLEQWADRYQRRAYVCGFDSPPPAAYGEPAPYLATVQP